MAEGLIISLTNDNNDTIELPLNPAEIKLKLETDDKSETIIDLGEINQIGESKLKSLTLESTIPVKPEDEHYLSSSKLLDSGQAYIDWITAVQTSKKPLRLVISTTKISFQATVAGFEYGFKDAYDREYSYILDLKEYRAYQAQKINESKPEAPQPEVIRPTPPAKMGMGSTVTVNGQLFRDSQGNGPGQMEQNATRKITLIAPDAPYPYHVSTLDGGARGWVKESELVTT